MPARDRFQFAKSPDVLIELITGIVLSWVVNLATSFEWNYVYGVAFMFAASALVSMSYVTLKKHMIQKGIDNTLLAETAEGLPVTLSRIEDLRRERFAEHQRKLLTISIVTVVLAALSLSFLAYDKYSEQRKSENLSRELFHRIDLLERRNG